MFDRLSEELLEGDAVSADEELAIGPKGRGERFEPRKPVASALIVLSKFTQYDEASGVGSFIENCGADRGSLTQEAGVAPLQMLDAFPRLEKEKGQTGPGLGVVPAGLARTAEGRFLDRQNCSRAATWMFRGLLTAPVHLPNSGLARSVLKA